MIDFPRKMDWVSDLVPCLDKRIEQFVVDVDEMDDELIEVFFAEIHRLTGDLKIGVDENNSDMIRMAAHSIKGMGGTMGLPEISVLGLEIENMAKAERVSDAKPMVDALGDWLLTLDQDPQ